jgi:hypothetical protein
VCAIDAIDAIDDILSSRVVPATLSRYLACSAKKSNVDGTRESSVASTE